VIHLYAVVRGVVDPALPGLDDVPVTTLEVGRLRAVVTRHPERVRASEDAALRHVAVVEQLADRADVVPVRFGSDHGDERGLTAELEEQEERLHALLDRVGGHVEFVIRTSATSGSGSAAVSPGGGASGAAAAVGDLAAGGSGRAYLEHRRDAVREREAAVLATRDRLREVSRSLVDEDVAVIDTDTRRGPERCFLVARGDAARFGERARRLAGEDGGLVVSGPWPPFTFAAAVPGHEEQR
jgi:hypothetical protein